METAYRAWERRRRGIEGRRSGHGRTSQKVMLGTRERRRLVQLILCLALFTGVFVGRGLFPAQLLAVRDDFLILLRTDTNFGEAFSRLGRSVSEGEPITDTLGALWTDVFGSAPLETAAAQGDAPLLKADMDYLAADGTDIQPLAAYLLGIEIRKTGGETEPAASPAPEPSTAPEEEPAVVHVDYTGPALPENTSMDRYVLGLGTTVLPVPGWLSSGFGWREHPVDGEERFHNGVDLAVNNGTSVKAFADGVVDYIGESPIYGRYLQIRHTGAVTTFYAHCSQLCVGQGETVTAGQEVAKSGDTGNTTGPHLHFEIKKNGVRLNPMYYIELEQG